MHSLTYRCGAVFILAALALFGCAPAASEPHEAAQAPPQPMTVPAPEQPPASEPSHKSPERDSDVPVALPSEGKTTSPPTSETPPADEGDYRPRVPQPAEAPYEGLTRLSPIFDVWVDKEKKEVVMVGSICLRKGPLEMLACLRGTKEHESILAVNTQAQVVHAALLAVGATPGAPVQFLPTFRAASGDVIEVTLIWKDAEGKEHRDRAQSWIRNAKTGKPMEEEWVFGGSGFFVDEMTGQRHYQAEDGDFICISNFPSAMLDLSVESSAANANLLFEANSDAIPEKDAKVTIVLKKKGPEAGG